MFQSSYRGSRPLSPESDPLRAAPFGTEVALEKRLHRRPILVVA
jgi:hypothetical protein